MTAPVEWIEKARLALTHQLTGAELEAELERLRDDHPRSLFEAPVAEKECE